MRVKNTSRSDHFKSYKSPFAKECLLQTQDHPRYKEWEDQETLIGGLTFTKHVWKKKQTCWYIYTWVPISTHVWVLSQGMLQFTFWAFPQHILLHFPNNLLHFPIKIASFTQKNAAFSQQFTAFPQQIASFPQQFDAFPHAMLCHFANKK